MNHPESRGQDRTRLSQPEAQSPEDLRPRDERYVIVEPPKLGGMGILFKAFDTRLERTVVVKRIRPEFSGEQTLVARFVKEAKTLARFRHVGIVQVLELAEDEFGPYIVMEWIDGESLAEIEKCHGPFQPSQAVEIIQRVAEGLQAAHQKGAIHRDIKPANILLDRSGQPYLVDFGLVRIESDSRASIAETVTGAMLGTLDFISPEQMKDPRQATELSDLWSLAATLYQMLTGFSVRARDDELLPEELRAVIARALKPRPADRYENVAAFAEALAVAMRGPVQQIEVAAAAVPKPEIVSSAVENDLAKLLEETTKAVGRKHATAKQLLQEHRYSEAAAVLGGIPDHLRDQGQWQDAVTRRDRVETLNGIVRKAVTELRLEGLRRSVEELLSLQPQRQDLASLLARLPADVESGGQTSEAAVGNRFGAKPRPPLLQSPFDSTQAVSAQEAWAKYLGLGVEVTNSLGMKFRVIPPGTFDMGSPDSEAKRYTDERPHKVTISQPMLFGVYPITQGEWLQAMGSNPAHFKSVPDQDTSRFPVENISWETAREFLATLNAKYSLPGWRYRLPTEAEWEYACRAGTMTPFSFGSELNSRQANGNGDYPYPDGAAQGPYLKRPSVVGIYSVNPFGLYDLHGNVWEWCGDWYGPYDVSSSQDPRGPSSGSFRVLRGGSWLNRASLCRSAFRNRFEPSVRGNVIGLRVVSELV